MRTIHTFTTSAVALLGLAFFGTNLAQAGHPVNRGNMGHGPVVNSSGTIGKLPSKGGSHESGHGRDKDWNKDWNKDKKYWDRYSYCYGYGYPTYCCPETPVCEVPVCAGPVCPAPVCEVPVCPEPVCVPTSCYQFPCSYDYCRSFEQYKHFHDGREPWHSEPSRNSGKPTTASSHRNTENLGSMAQHTSGGKGRR